MMTNPRVISLFSGVGGLELALELLWHATPVLFCEPEPYQRAVLAWHWPGVAIHDDVRTLDGRRFRGADIVAGGFPCQDISTMGTKAGLEGPKSGLWREFARVIEKVDPSVVVIENVKAIRFRGLDRVLRDLTTLRFDAAWTTVEGREAGLYILRPRVFVLAIARGQRRQGEPPAWLHDHRQPRDHAHRRNARLAWPREQPRPPASPKPGLLRGAAWAARGLDEARRRARLRCTGNAVATAQAVLGLQRCLNILSIPASTDRPQYE